MTTTSSTVATRNGSAPVRQDAALTLRSGQTRFDEQQRSALATLGIPASAPQSDLDVFLHVSQRMGLDPFAKQIHLVYYRVNEGVYNPRTRQWEDNWIEKPSIQTGIAGFRVQRDRVAARLGVLIDYDDTLWFDENGKPTDVWLLDANPTACRVVTRISDGRHFSATIRFNEFAKRTKNGQLTGRWRDAHSYQIEKCAEAASLRKAFPQDFAGLDLDAEIESDPDAPPPAPAQPQRQRVDAAAARARNPQTVAASVVTPDASPAGEQPPPAAPVTPSGTPAGEVQINPDQVKAIWSCLNQDYGFTSAEKDQARAAVGILARHPIESVNDLTSAEASKVLDQLHAWVEEGKQTGERPRGILAADIASRDADPREDGDD